MNADRRENKLARLRRNMARNSFVSYSAFCDHSGDSDLRRRVRIWWFAARYFRDRPKLIITVRWDLRVTDNPTYDSSKPWGIVRVTNMGRRPSYLAVVALHIPRAFRTPGGFEHTHLVLARSMEGRRLTERDAPAGFVVDQDMMMVKYSEAWQEIRAVAEDSTGKAYKSNTVSERPSWADHHGQKTTKTEP